MGLHTKKMKALFEAADESGDGALDYDEFMTIITKPEVKSWLAAQQLDVSDAELMFVLMDDGDGEITAPELVKAAAKLKGPARSIDLHNLMREHDDLKEVVLKISQGVVRVGNPEDAETGTTCANAMSVPLCSSTVNRIQEPGQKPWIRKTRKTDSESWHAD